MSLENVILFLDEVKEQKLATDVLSIFGKHAISFSQFDDVSRIYFKIKDYDNAIYYGEKAYAIASTPEQMYTIRHNLINVYNHNNYPEKALRYIRANEAVMEHDNDRDFEKAFSLFLLNRKTEAGALLRKKLVDPTLTDEQKIKVEFNIGTYDLIDGNFQQGLKRFLLSGEELGIWGHDTFITQKKETYGLTKWNGIVKPGLKLLVIAEAGIGDEIINVRFMHTLHEYGIHAEWLTLNTRSELVEIYKLNNISACSDITQISTEFLKDCYYVYSMQLPVFLNLKYEDLYTGPYLSNIPVDVDKKWKNILTSNKVKVGIRWQGNPSYDQDLHRSIPLIDIMNALPIDLVFTMRYEFDLFSIQRDTGLEELKPFSFIDSNGLITDLSSKLETLYDLFACINNLDLVITSCTSVAHIAAAMGKEVCVIVPISCYYVWCNPTDSTPWYGDNVHVFYQKHPRSWSEPLLKLTEYLTNTY